MMHRRPANIFKQNLRIIEKRFPDIFAQIGNDVTCNAALNNTEEGIGLDAICSNNAEKLKTVLYSREDPEIFARELIYDWQFEPYDMIFFVGMALGYLPTAALKGDIGNPRMVIIEPSIHIFEHALHFVDLQLLLANTKVDFFVGKDINLEVVLERYQEQIAIGRNLVHIHPNYEQIFGKTILEIKQGLADRIRANRDNWATTKKYGRQMLSNAISNLPSLFAGNSLKLLRGKLKGVPTVCIAAGPSLDSSLYELKQLKNKALLIACDSAVNVLLRAGIRPHIVVTADIFETNLEKLKSHMAQLRDAILIFGIESNPDNVRLYLGQQRIAVTAYNKLLTNWIDPKLDLQCRLPAMTSVSHVALFTALALEADPIVLVGMDLAYVQGKSHAFGSVFYHSIEKIKRVSTQSNKGFPIFTSPQFVADKLLIEKAIIQSPATIINTSLDGAYIEGAQIKSLSESRSKHMDSHVPIDDLLGGITWEPCAKESCTDDILQALVGEFEKFKTENSSYRSELLEQLRWLENQSNPPDNSPEIRSYFGKKFLEFQKKNHGVILLIKEVMLADFEMIFREGEVLADKYGRDGTTQCFDEINLVVKIVESYERGASFILSLLNQGQVYISQLRELKKEKTGLKVERDKHIELARWFGKNGELWQAEREYTRCFEIDPKNIGIYRELVQLYLKAELWHAASELVEKASSLFGDIPEIIRLKNEIEGAINGIMVRIKEEWTQGNANTTRKLLNEYLILCPDDPQATLLKKVIMELDKEFSLEWMGSTTRSNSQPPFEQRLNLAAECIQRLELEKGIGILEGITADFPGANSGIRERIGDCRMLQKDYKSAVFNYGQSLRDSHRVDEVRSKISKARKILEVAG
jgi:hypothetical protein